MRIDSILRWHNKYKGNSELPKVLGDGYLFARNPIFRNIRNAVSSLGYTFTDQDFCNYRFASLRLTALPDILSQRKIPYCHTATAVKALNAKAPGRISTDSIYFGADTPLLHESCHCLVEDLFAKIVSPKATTTQGAVLRAAIAEAFALATDAMACVSAEQKIHLFFYSFNSYLKPEVVTAIQDILKAAVQSLGFHRVYRVLIYSAILKIFLQEKLTKENKKILLSLLEVDGRSLSKEQWGLVKMVSSIWLRPASGAEEEFYSKASKMYFTLVLGRRAELRSLFSFSPLTTIENSAPLKAVIDHLIQTAHSGLQTRFSMIKKHQYFVR